MRPLTPLEPQRAPDNAPLARWTVPRFLAEHPHLAWCEHDLLSCALERLCHAARYFDAGRGLTFVAYAICLMRRDLRKLASRLWRQRLEELPGEVVAESAEPG